jgi:hypothetical protein
MAMTPQLFSLSALAVELDRDRRTVARALRHVPPDGKVHGRDGWRMTTAITALDRLEGVRNRNIDRADADLDLLEVAARRVDEALDTLRTEPDVGKRRELVRGGLGHVVGELERAVERVRADHSPKQRMVEQPFIDQMCGGAIAEVMALCRWEIRAPTTRAR